MENAVADDASPSRPFLTTPCPSWCSTRGDALAGMEHAVQWWRDRNWRAGAMCVVRHDTASGIRWGAADPRRPAYALGR